MQSNIYLSNTFQSYHDAEQYPSLSPAQKIKEAFYSQPCCVLSSSDFSSSSAQLVVQRPSPRVLAPIRVLQSHTAPTPTTTYDEVSKVTFSVSERPNRGAESNPPRTPRSPPASLASVLEEEEEDEDEDEPEFGMATIDFSSLWGASRPSSSHVKRSSFRTMVPPLETVTEEVWGEEEEDDEIYSFDGRWRQYLPTPRPSYCSISEGSISSEEPTLADWSSATEDDDDDLDLIDAPRGANIGNVGISEPVEIDTLEDSLDIYSREVLKHIDNKQVLSKAPSRDEYLNRSETPTGSSSGRSRDAGSSSTKGGRRRISQYLKQASSRLVTAWGSTNSVRQ